MNEKKNTEKEKQNKPKNVAFNTFNNTQRSPLIPPPIAPLIPPSNLNLKRADNEINALGPQIVSIWSL